MQAATLKHINPLWSIDVLWHQRSWLSKLQVMAWCHQALSHHMNQSWISNNKTSRDRYEWNFNEICKGLESSSSFGKCFLKQTQFNLNLNELKKTLIENCLSFHEKLLDTHQCVVYIENIHVATPYINEMVSEINIRAFVWQKQYPQ